MPAFRTVIVSVAALAVAAAVSTPGVASALDDEQNSRDLLRSGLVGSMPDGPTLSGALPGSAPWVADADSSIRVRRDGRVDIRIRGLVIPTAPQNGTNPVPQVSASVVCNGTAVTSSTPTTLAVRFDAAGDARILDRVALPSPCLAPVVLVHPNRVLLRYIAASG